MDAARQRWKGKGGRSYKAMREHKDLELTKDEQNALRNKNAIKGLPPPWPGPSKHQDDHGAHLRKET